MQKKRPTIKQAAWGTRYPHRLWHPLGLIYFKGDDAHTLRDLLKRQEDLDFYV
ncbi:hypothetical protein [Halomonas sp.]|uniref:hypothetical protein n=1 Tax=unclassified Halomonas TaxID=2609666 RepID=UPI003F91FCE2